MEANKVPPGKGIAPSPPFFPPLSLSLTHTDLFTPGGLQAGSSTLGLGLGGGWNIATNNMTAGVGIGLPNDVKANISVSLDYKGGAVFRIGYSASLSCVPSQSREGTDFAIVCRTPTSDLA